MCRPSALACDACDAPTPDFARLVRSFPKVWARRGTVLKHIRHPLGLCRAELILQDEDLRRRNRLVRAALLLAGDRKSTRLNSSHITISYAVFCLKKKNNKK